MRFPPELERSFADPVELGQGGMGVVFRAIQKELARPVAVKLLPPLLQDEAEPSARLVQEAKLAARIHHPNVVTLLGAGETDEGVVYVVYEFLEGEPLSARLERLSPLLSETRHIVRAILAGLEAIHEAGVLHRDLKPENVFLLPNGSVKIIDLGISRRIAGAEIQTRTGVILGTPHYLAPEVISGNEPGPAADLYAVGTILYRLATGRLPFDGGAPARVLSQQLSSPPTDPLTIRPALPPELVALLQAALAKEPAGRPATAVAFRKQLEEIRASDISTRLRPPFSDPGRTMRVAPISKDGLRTVGRVSSRPQPHARPHSRTRTSPVRHRPRISLAASMWAALALLVAALLPLIRLPGSATVTTAPPTADIPGMLRALVSAPTSRMPPEKRTFRLHALHTILEQVMRGTTVAGRRLEPREHGLLLAAIMLDEAQLARDTLGMQVEPYEAMGERLLARLHGELGEVSLSHYWMERFQRHPDALPAADCEWVLPPITSEEPHTPIAFRELEPDLNYLEEFTKKADRKRWPRQEAADPAIPAILSQGKSSRYFGLSRRIIRACENYENTRLKTQKARAARTAVDAWVVRAASDLAWDATYWMLRMALWQEKAPPAPRLPLLLRWRVALVEHDLISAVSVAHIKHVCDMLGEERDVIGKVVGPDEAKEKAFPSELETNWLNVLDLGSGHIRKQTVQALQELKSTPAIAVDPLLIPTGLIITLQQLEYHQRLVSGSAGMDAHDLRDATPFRTEVSHLLLHARLLRRRVDLALIAPAYGFVVQEDALWLRDSYQKALAADKVDVPWSYYGGFPESILIADGPATDAREIAARAAASR